MEKQAARKASDVKEHIGRVLINLGQLTFGSFVLGGVLRGEIPQSVILTCGVFTATVFIVLGVLCVKKEKE
jgi:hypothetical protein